MTTGERGMFYLTAIVAIWLRSPHSAKNVRMNDCNSKQNKLVMEVISQDFKSTAKSSKL